MSDEKIKVTVEHKTFIGEGESGIVVVVKMEKDNFETTVKIPVGDKVSSKEFVLASTALYQAATVFHHQMYSRLREKMEDLNKGFEKSPALLEKDQRGG